MAVKEIEFTTPGAVLGTYEGECADSNITNLNGLDITREVWENVFASDEYKRGIENHWFIGYLGHPADVDDQDFRKACIVMTEGHVADNGKVYGKFNLVNTPVGQIVKAFQDAGVIFGISVRGAGDIINNSVDPDTFIFRGFDLVTFPAFPESIPKFTAIAASTDAGQRQKYQAVCAAVKANIDSLDTVESVSIVQSCFAKQSDEYKQLEERKQQLKACEEVVVTEVPEVVEEVFPEGTTVADQIAKEDACEDGTCEELDPRIDSMTMLYLETKKKLDDAIKENTELKIQLDSLMNENARRVASIERIFTSQMNDLNKNLEAVEGSLEVKTGEANSLRYQLDKKARSLSRVESSAQELQANLQKVQASLDASIQKNKRLHSQLIRVSDELKAQKEENLKYNEKIEAAQAALDSKESIISSTKIELDETVRKYNLEKQKSSNRDDQMESMKSRLQSVEASIKTYQEAYAHLYANALGIRPPKLSVTASTDVDNLQKMIRAGTSIPMKPDVLEPTQDVDPSYFDVTEYEENDLVTL